MHKGMLKAENIFQQRFRQIPRTCKKVQSLDLSIKTLHLRQIFLVTDYQLVFGFFRIMSFYILDDFEYFVTAHTLFFQLSNEINDFFACHVFTHFPPPPFQVVLYHSAKPLFNYQSTVFIFREFIRLNRQILHGSFICKEKISSHHYRYTHSGNCCYYNMSI